MNTPCLNDRYIIVPSDATEDEMIEYRRCFAGYECVKAEKMEPVYKKPKLHWKDNLKKNRIKT